MPRFHPGPMLPEPFVDRYIVPAVRVFLLASLLFSLSLGGCDKGGSASGSTSSTGSADAKGKQDGVDVELTKEAYEAARLRIAPARRADRRGALVAHGTLDLSPKRVAKIGSLVDGRVTSMRVTIGDHVKAGEVLATIESVAVGRARADYYQAQARLKQAEKELLREQQLQRDGVASERVVTAAHTDRDVAAFEARAAAERLRAVGLDPGAAGGAASGAVSLATPLAGVVLNAKARVGEAVAPADSLFTVGDLAELWLLVDVYERDLARVRAGDAVRVSAVAAPGRVFEGRVDHVHEAIDPARRAADVRIVLPNPDGVLRPGMSATARIAVGAEATSAPAPAATGAPSAAATAAPAPDERVVLVPRGAIQLIDGLAHVFVERGERKFEMRAIEAGAAYEGDVEVMRGLLADERVVVEGAFILKSQALREQMGAND